MKEHINVKYWTDLIKQAVNTPYKDDMVNVSSQLPVYMSTWALTAGHINKAWQ